VAFPFAVCLGLELAVRAVGSTDNAAIREWLADRTPEDPVRTIMGDFSWDERGLPVERDYIMTQWQGDELEFIFPIEEVEGVTEIVYPKPEW
jgi:branched-chain amino acid transport system substrate-binding protein